MNLFSVYKNISLNEHQVIKSQLAIYLSNICNILGKVATYNNLDCWQKVKC